ncbi:MAG: putative glycosyltransferase [Fibrobacteres bacterium]|nr:putative glycosyltransferase [Fibrobacterota bacterium]
MNNPESILLGLSSLSAVAMLAGAIYNALTAPRLESGGKSIPRACPRVSLLIPARNEEANLGILLPLLARLEWPGLEILILDDQSSDGTPRIAGLGPGRLLAGRPLPQGWIGKNWACHQLAEEASGDILIFCDADVRPRSDAVFATVSLMESGGLDALTCLPRQILGTWSEKAVIPHLLSAPLFGFLPMALVSRLPVPALSMGCGQWFAFTRAAYAGCGGHAGVRREVVEDMALARRVKAHGMILGASFSTRCLSTRMYRDLPGLWSGFSKNMVYFTGTGLLRPPIALAAFLIVNVLPWVMPLCGHGPWLVPLAFWAAARLLTARVVREPFSAWFWSPLGTLLVPSLAARSWWLYRTRSVAWKDRILSAAFSASEVDQARQVAEV